MFGLFNNKKIEVGRTIQVGQHLTMARGTDPQGSMGLGFPDMIQVELAGMKGTITNIDGDHITVKFIEPIGEVELMKWKLVGGGTYNKPKYEYDTGMGKPWFPALGEPQPATLY